MYVVPVGLSSTANHLLDEFHAVDLEFPVEKKTLTRSTRIGTDVRESIVYTGWKTKHVNVTARLLTRPESLNRCTPEVGTEAVASSATPVP